MRESILISGVSGTGKSTLAETLLKLGCEAYDIEDEEYDMPNGVGSLFNMFRKDTGQIYEGFDNSRPSMVVNANWNCDPEMLKNFIGNQKNRKSILLRHSQQYA